MATAKTSGSANLAQLLESFGPMFMGKGDVVTKPTVDQDALAASKGIASQALSNASNAETETADIVSRIITKNAIAFGPVKAGARMAGLYNDTVTRQLASEAQAASTAEASNAVLNYRTNQLALAQRANADVLAATKGQITKQKPVIPPLVTKAATAGILGYAGYKNRNEIKDFFKSLTEEGPKTAEASDVIAGTPDPLTGEYAPFGEYAASASAIAPGGATFNETSSLAGDEIDAGVQATQEAASFTAVDTGVEALNFDQMNILAGETAGIADAADAAGGVDALTGIADMTDASNVDALIASGDATFSGMEGAGEAIDVAASAADSTDALDAAFGAAEGADALGVAADSIGVSIPWIGPSLRAAQGDFGGAAGSAIGGTIGSFAGPVGTVIGSVIGGAIGGGGSIICTELMVQKKMDRRLWAKSMRHFQTYEPVSIEAYQLLAAPFLKHLRSRPNSKLSKGLEVLFNARAKYVSGDTSTVNTLAYMAVSSAVIGFGLTVYPVIKLYDKYRWFRWHLYLRGIGVIS